MKTKTRRVKTVVSGRFEGMTQRSLAFLHAAFFDKYAGIVTTGLKSSLNSMGIMELDFIAIIVGNFASQKWYASDFECDCAVGISWLYDHIQKRQILLESRSIENIYIRSIEQDMEIWAMWDRVIEVERARHEREHQDNYWLTVEL